MTVNTSTNKSPRLVADGVIDTFNFSFRIFAAVDIDVYRIVRATNAKTLQSLTTHYTVSIQEAVEGGSITFLTPPPATDDVLIVRNIAITQPLAIPDSGPVTKKQLEDQLDRTIMAVQQVDEAMSRALQIDISDPSIPNIIPSLVTGGVLTNDGVDLIWSNLIVLAGAVPGAANPGDDGKVLEASGGNWTWQHRDLANIVDMAAFMQTLNTRTTAALARADLELNLATLVQHALGLGVSNNAVDPADDIDIAVGTKLDSTSSEILTLASPLVKRLDANWAEGTTQGGLFTGSKAGATWYHVFLIKKDSTGVVDVGFDTSFIAANRPGTHTKYALIGSILTHTPAAIEIMPFHMVRMGPMTIVRWKDPPFDVDSVGALDNTGLTFTISVPTGRPVLAALNIYYSDSTGRVYVKSPDVNVESPTAGSAGGAGPMASLSELGGGGSDRGVGPLDILTNASAQIAVVSDAVPAASTNFWATTLGWMEYL